MSTLAGLRIVITRAIHQMEALAAPLRERGAQVLSVPLIGIAAPEDPGPLREAAAACDQYDWIVFTSANAVAAFAAELPRHGPTFRARFAAIGATTSEAAQEYGFPVVLTPREYVAESLVESFADENLQHTRVLIPSAAVTRDVVPSALRALGAEVEVVEAYRNVVPSGARERLRELLCEPYPDWIVFASPSAVDRAVLLADPESLRCSKIASIGPVTSTAICKHEIAVAVEAEPHTIAGLVAAIESVA